MTGNTFYFEWEVRLMEWLQSIFNNSFGVAFFSFMSDFGEELICIAILGFFYWGLNKETGKYIGTNVLVNLIWNPLIKNIFVRRRPYFDNKSIKILKLIDKDAEMYDIDAQGFSFPSGHSSNSATVYGSLIRSVKHKWVRVFCVIITLLVGVSRFVLGAHYPTDVLCGWALGILIVFLIPWLRTKVKNDYLFYGILLLTGIPGFFYCTSNDYYTGIGTMIGAFAGFIFEAKVVKFDNTKNVIRIILRILGGAAIYLALNKLLKLPFSSEFLDAGTLAARLVRTIRYAIVLFVAVGVYPILFKFTAKIGKKAE